MCMGQAGWGGMDGQYVIGDAVGGKLGGLIKKQSPSGILTRHGAAEGGSETVAAPAVTAPNQVQEVSSRQRRSKSLIGG